MDGATPPKVLDVITVFSMGVDTLDVGRASPSTVLDHPIHLIGPKEVWHDPGRGSWESPGVSQLVLWLYCRCTVNQMHCLSTFSQLNTNILLYDLQKYKSSLYGQLNTRKKLATFKNNVAT